MKLLTWSMQRLQKLLQGNAAVIIPAAAACLLALPSTFTGLCLEDYYFRAVLAHGDSLPEFSRRSPLDVFSFNKRNDPAALRAGMDYGIYPWWTAQNFIISFCRPLTSLTHWFDFKVFKDAYWAMHLHSMLWFSLLALAASAAYRRFLPTVWIAGLAALLYAIDDARAAGATFLANRSATIAAVLSMLTLCSYDAWRRTRSAAAAILSVLVFSIGLLAAEAQLCVCAYLFSYALFIEKGPLAKRVAPLVPFAAVVLLWRLACGFFSFSVAGTSLYINPQLQPSEFLLQLPFRLAALLLALVLGPHAMLMNHLPGGLAYVYGAAALIVVLLLVRLLRPLFLKNPVMSFFGLGAVLSLLPLCAALPDDRLLFLPGFGAMGIIAVFLSGALDPKSCLRASKAAQTLGIAFLCIHLLLAPLLFQANAFTAWCLQRPISHMADVLGKFSAQQISKIAIVNSPMDLFVSYLPYVIMERGMPAPERILLLSAGQTQATLERTDDRSLLLRLPQGLLASVFDRVLRDDPASLKPGDAVRLADVAVTVNALTPDGRPSAMSFVFTRSLECLNLKWFYWTREGLAPFMTPGIGHSVTIPAPPHFLNLIFSDMPVSHHSGRSS